MAPSVSPFPLFRLKIPRFETAAEIDHCIVSSIRSYLGFRWCVYIYPNGKSGDLCSRFFLHCGGPEDDSESDGEWISPTVDVEFLILISEKGEKSFEYSTGPHCEEFTREFPDLKAGWFLSLSTVLRENDDFLSSDGSVSIDVFVSRNVKIDEDAAQPTDQYEPGIVSLYDQTQNSFADVSISGNDGGKPTRAHRVILGARAEYFQKMFTFHNSADDPDQNARMKTDFTIEDLSSTAVRILLRRIYGEPFPDVCIAEDHIDMLLEIWHFTSVSFMAGLPDECVELVKEAVCTVPGSATRSFKMAALLDNEEMQRFLIIKILEGNELSSDAQGTLTFDDMILLVKRAPPGLEALKRADSWLKYDKERSIHGAELFLAFQFDKYPRYSNKDVGALDIVKLHAPRESLLFLLCER